MKTSFDHPLKEHLKEKKIRLWMLRNLTGVPESRMSRYLNGIDPMPPRLEKQINVILDALYGTPQDEVSPEAKAIVQEWLAEDNRLNKIVKAVKEGIRGDRDGLEHRNNGDNS